MLTSVFFANFLGLSTPVEASSTSPKDTATNLNRSKDLKKLSLTIEQDLNPTAVNHLQNTESLLVKFKNSDSKKNLSILKKTAQQNNYLDILKFDQKSNQLFSVSTNSSSPKVEVLKKIATKIKQQNEVNFVQPVYKYKLLTEPYEPKDPKFESRQWYLQDSPSGIQMPSAWAYLGEVSSGVKNFDCTTSKICGGNNSVKVAVIDSGVNTSLSDFDQNTFDIKNSALFYSDNCDSTEFFEQVGRDKICFRQGTQFDNEGHGSSVASVLGMRQDDIGGVGVAYNTKILPIALHGKAINTSTVISAFDYAVSKGAKVINLSLGTEAYDPVVREAIQEAVSKGVVVVAASGNCANINNQSCKSSNNPYIYPAAFSNTISVGASNYATKIEDITRSSYSTYNEFVDVVAPVGDGKSANSFVVNECPVKGYNGCILGQEVFSMGTSFAAPQVSGLVALMASINPNIDQQGVRAILANTSKDLGSKGKDLNFGYGLIDAKSALSKVIKSTCKDILEDTFCADYFASPDFKGSPVYQEQVLTQIDKSWGLGSPSDLLEKDNFSARFSGNFRFTPANYRFKIITNAEDQARLFVSGAKIIDSSENSTLVGEKSLKAGLYNLRLDYQEGTGDAKVKLLWQKSGCPEEDTGDFRDVFVGDTFYTPICNLKADQIIQGFGDGTFKAEQEVKRGAMAKFVRNAIFGRDYTNLNCPDFSDVPATHTFYQEITTLKCEKVVSGFGDGEFKPDREVSRGEALKFLINSIDKVNKDLDILKASNDKFYDVPASHPFYSYISAGVDHGIVNGYSDGSFKPEGFTVRGAMAKMVENGRKLRQ
jgi:subtilisin family serine protease